MCGSWREPFERAREAFGSRRNSRGMLGRQRDSVRREEQMRRRTQCPAFEGAFGANDVVLVGADLSMNMDRREERRHLLREGGPPPLFGAGVDPIKASCSGTALRYNLTSVKTWPKPQGERKSERVPVNGPMTGRERAPCCVQVSVGGLSVARRYWTAVRKEWACNAVARVSDNFLCNGDSRATRMAVLSMYFPGTL
jgi:hypothetical protein